MRIAKLRRSDPVTGLAGPTRFRLVSERALAQGRTAVLLLDLNGIPEPRLLVELARVLRVTVAKPGVAFRLGGDEFAAVLPKIQFPEQAYEVAGAIASALSPVIVDGRLTPLSASIGLAVSRPGELSHDELVHCAELALRRAKRSGPETRWAVWQDGDATRRGAA